MENKTIDDVLVVGGGTAGLITAITLVKHHPALTVKLVRSTAIGHIMVGEGTVGATPKMFHVGLGIDKENFFNEVRPTWKHGIRFLWGQRPWFDYTFTSQIGGRRLPESRVPLGYPLIGADWQGLSLESALMSRNGVGLKGQCKNPIYSAPNSAYHFENERFVGFLERHAIGLGVEIIEDKLISVETDERGVKSIDFESGAVRTADLYVDATGFRAELIHGALNEPFVSMSDALFCDKAIVGGWERVDEPIQPYTTAETMNAGWCWRIEHERIINRGYVFSSQFISTDQAVKEFQHSNKKIQDVRVVPFESRRIKRAWVNNVVAIGNANGFVEPLEATNIQVICSFALDLANSLMPSRKVGDVQMELFNQNVHSSWSSIKDFLALHYRFNNRLDTPFWRFVNAETPLGELEPLIEAYKKIGPNHSLTSLMPKGDLFGVDGVLVMLLGMQVPWLGSSDPLSSGVLAELSEIKRNNVLHAMQSFNTEHVLKL